MGAAQRTEVRGRGWKRPIRIDAGKFDAVARAILDALTAEPVPLRVLVERVAARLPAFDGSVAWYTISCARELELRGELLRQARPVRYGLPARDSGARAATSAASSPATDSARCTPS